MLDKINCFHLIKINLELGNVYRLSIEFYIRWLTTPGIDFQLLSEGAQCSLKLQKIS